MQRVLHVHRTSAILDVDFKGLLTFTFLISYSIANCQSILTELYSINTR